MIRRPPRSTRTGHTLSRHDVLPILASGANFGLRRTVPHALGVGIGFTLMIILVGVGLMELFDLFPILNLILKVRSEEHTSELQSLMRISYAVFCLKQKNNIKRTIIITIVR